MGSSLGAALLPWLVFLVAARTGGIGFAWASAAGFVCAGAVLLYSRRRGARRGFESASLAAFAALTGSGVAASPHWPDLDDYSRVIAAVILAALALGSLARRPLSEAYTRDAVAQRDVAAPWFSLVNRRVTLVAGATAVLLAVSYAAGTRFNGGIGSTVFNWFVPIAVILGAARCCIVHWHGVASDHEPEEEALLASVGALADLAGPREPSPPDSGRVRRGRPHLRSVAGGRGR